MTPLHFVRIISVPRFSERKAKANFVVLTFFLLLFTVSCGNWGTVTGETAREAIDLHETDLPALPGKKVYKTIEADKRDAQTSSQELSQ